MNIPTMIEDLKTLISKAAITLNLEESDMKLNKHKIEDNNQCSIGAIGYSHLCLIAHKDVRVVEDFLKLSPETIQTIEKVRKFGASVLEDENNLDHLLQKTHIKNDTEIELSIIGNGYPSFRVIIHEGVLSVSASAYAKSDNYNFDSYETLDSAINAAANTLIPAFIKSIGFDETKDEKSPEIINFVSKTAEQMFVDTGLNPMFNYTQPDDLVRLVCADLHLNVNDVLGALNYKENDSYVNLYIPKNLTTMMSTMAQHLVNIDGIKSKMDQLINLVILYNHITGKVKGEKFSVTFSPIQKINFFKDHSINRRFYTLNISETLVVHIGHNLCRNQVEQDIYIGDGDDLKLFSFIHLKDLSTYDYKEYITNDIDYIYNVILTDLRSIIIKALCKDDDVITAKDLEVYKMAVF